MERACRVAGRSDDPIHRRLRDNDKAQALLMVNRPAEALPLVAVTPEDNPYFRTGLLLKQTEAYLAMDKASDAHDHLHQAYSIIETHNILSSSFSSECTGATLVNFAGKSFMAF